MPRLSATRSVADDDTAADDADADANVGLLRAGRGGMGGGDVFVIAPYFSPDDGKGRREQI